MINMNDLELNNILLYEETHELLQFMILHAKLYPLHIIFDKVDHHIRKYHKLSSIFSFSFLIESGILLRSKAIF